MSISRTYSVFLLLLIAYSAQAQVIDTTRSMNTWLLKHNYSRFEDTRVDTSLYRLHLDHDPLNRYDFAYERMGIIGQPAQAIDFFNRPGSDLFMFSYGLQPYMATPERTVFYNTRKPFSEIRYSNTIGQDGKEETVHFLHTQNVDPFSNFGIDFELLSGKELYINQDAQATKFTLFGSRAKERYTGFGTFHFNRFNIEQNGGLKNPENLRNNTLEENWLYPVNLSDANGQVTNLQLFYTQKYDLSKKLYRTDSLGVTTDTGRNVSLNHQLIMQRDRWQYKDEFSYTNIPDFYFDYFYDVGNPLDSVSQDEISNTFQLLLGDPYRDAFSGRFYVGHGWSRYGQLSPMPVSDITVSGQDTILPTFKTAGYHALNAGFQLGGPPENTWYWTLSGNYQLSNLTALNEIQLDATIARSVSDTAHLGFRGLYHSEPLNYYYLYYSSAFHRYNNFNTLRNPVRYQASFFFEKKDESLGLRIKGAMIEDLPYWSYGLEIPSGDEHIEIVNANLPVFVGSARLFAKLEAGRFSSKSEVLLQFTDSPGVLNLPLLAAWTSNYYTQDLFKGALTFQLGADLYITTPYNANGYIPALGAFYTHPTEQVGGFPFLDVYLGLKVKRTRAYFAYQNGLAGIVSNNYFTMANYPTKPSHIRFGLSWTFYD